MNERKMDQKEYLKKYLSGEVGHAKKKKKKKDKQVGNATVTIVDDDFDISKMADATEEELDNYTLGEDLPQIAGIIDERPPDVIAKESGKWKSVVGNESRSDCNLTLANSPKQLNESSCRDRIRLASPRKHSRKCIEVSPLHRSKEISKCLSKNSVNLSSKRKSDASPPRTSRRISDVSAAQKSRNIADSSPKRKSERDSDASPPRRSKRGSNISPNLSLRNNFDLQPKRETGGSPLCRLRRSPDFSPKRRTKKSVSPRRYSRNRDDISLHRSKQSPDSHELCKDFELKSKKSRWDTKETASRNSYKTSDHNPSQKMRISEDCSPRRIANTNLDFSPPRCPKLSPQNYRKSTGIVLNTPGQRRSNHNAGISLRLRRQKRTRSPRPLSSEGGEARDKITYSDSPPPTHKKMIKTLEGKVAGLQDAKALRDENEQFKKREEEMFKLMAEKYKDEDCQTVRDRKTGRRRNVCEDVEKEREKLIKEDKRKETYSRWGAGLKQIEDFKYRVASETHEMSKPMARYADDKDLEDHLRNQCRDGDPMAEYFRKKQKEISSGPSVPIYQGAFPENRFNIRPGYRWDGVDRSNGYEKKWFDVQSKKKAVEEEAYKYSVEDM